MQLLPKTWPTRATEPKTTKSPAVARIADRNRSH